jgi:hypothetical protein
MQRSEILVVGAGLLLAGFVLWKVVMPVSEQPSTEVAAPAVPVTAPATPVLATPTVPEPEPGLGGVPESVASALARAGHTEFVGTVDLESQLPPSVVAVLVEAGATLRVPEVGP